MFVVVETRIGKIREMRFYLIFSFLGFKVVNKRTINFSRILSGWIEKYKTALIKLDSSYCERLVIVSLDVDVDRLQFLVSDDNFFCCGFSNF